MQRVLKWIGIGLGALVGLVLMAAGVLYLIGSARVNRTYEVEAAQLTLVTDSATLARGAHLVRTLGCGDCHTENLGGQVLEDAPPFRVVAANLTSGRGGVGARYSVEDFDRAIRHGVRPDGRPLIVMPSAAYHRVSDEDAAALIAYLKSVPPVDNELPPTEIRTVGRLMAAIFIDPAAEVRTGRAREGRPPQAGPTAEYGAYLASATCAHCHGENLRGNPTPPGPPGMLPAPDLVASATRWTPDQFKQTLRTGTTPEGNQLNPQYMPWSLTAAMEEYELDALYAYLRSLDGRPTASR